MILVVDCGNTRIKWAHAAAGKLMRAASAAHGENTDAAIAALVASLEPGVDRALVANVAGAAMAAKLTAALSPHLERAPEFPAVTASAHGIECAYRDPARLGVDRWLAMIAAARAVRGPVCVLGAGTAVTFDAVAAGGRHLGGLILVGARLAADTLDRATGGIGRTSLPQEKPDGLALLGRSTDEAVGNGSLLAIAAALDRAVVTVGRALGERPAVLLTGGDAARLAPWLETEVQLRADLVLEGLASVAADGG